MEQARVDIVPAAFIAIILPPSQGQVPPNLQHSKGLLPKDFSLHFVLSVTLSSLSKSFALRPLTILFSSGPKNMVKKVRKMMVAEEEPCGRNLLGLFLNLSNGLPDFWLNREFQHLKRSKYQKYFCLYFCIKLACKNLMASFFTLKLVSPGLSSFLRISLAKNIWLNIWLWCFSLTLSTRALFSSTALGQSPFSSIFLCQTHLSPSSSSAVWDQSSGFCQIVFS